VGALATKLVLVLALLCAPARAEDKPQPDPDRYEPAGFPVVAGSTDIGVEFGVAATLTRFYAGAKPYQWRMDLLLSTSLKSVDGTLGFVQQSHVLRLDAPQLFGGRLRLDTRASFDRSVNQGYFGLGNTRALVVSAGDASDRFYEYLFQQARVRTIGRVRLDGPWRIAFAADARYVTPEVYEDSRLAQDVDLIGQRHTFLFKLGAGLMYDSRDSEFLTNDGLFYQLGTAGTFGTSGEHIAYGEVSVVLSHYLSLSNIFTFAARVVTSYLFGRVPFYDLSLGGVFEPQRMLGGEFGVRGVPQGRYHGNLKLLSNIELRAKSERFTWLGQFLRVGGTTFVDVGRLWSDGDDGTGPGIKYGIGGGVFLQWGDAAIFRIDVAYSPDARAENPGLPLGIYASDGLLF
jgi:hypothetical protein